MPRHHRRSDRRARLSIDRLEGRQLLAASISDIVNGVVTITGTDEADVIGIAPAPGASSQVDLIIRSGSLSLSRRFQASAIREVVVDALGGNDMVDNTSSVVARVNGGTGDDILRGGSGADSLSGGAGNDTIEGRGGDDATFGGAGNDTYVYGPTGNLGRDTVVEEVSTDIDTLDFSGFESAVSVDLGRTDWQNIWRITPTELSLPRLALRLTTSTGIENVIGSSRSDWIRGNSRDNDLTGNGGDDVLDGADGYDLLDGGAGNDLLNGGAGPDEISGGEGDDILNGGAGDDLLNGGWGNDALEGGSGNDNLLGDIGNDTYIFSGSGNLGADSLSEVLLADDDVLDFSGMTAGFGVDVDLKLSSTQVVNPQLSLSLGNPRAVESVIGTPYDDVIVGNMRPNRLYGGAGNDTLRAFHWSDHLWGQGGNDRYIIDNTVDNVTLYEDPDLLGLFTNTGPDSGDTVDLYWVWAPITFDLGSTQWQTASASNVSIRLSNSAGFENVIGGISNDTIYGNNRTNTIRGGDGNDTIYGRGGNDFLYGDEGADTLYGEGGNDFLSGGVDGLADQLWGGTGADIFLAEWFLQNSITFVDRENARDRKASEGDTQQTG